MKGKYSVGWVYKGKSWKKKFSFFFCNLDSVKLFCLHNLKARRQPASLAIKTNLSDFFKGSHN